MNHKQSDSNWEKLSTALRGAGVSAHSEEEDRSAPHGFATRIVSRFQADERADAAGLSSWRRLSLTGAACAVLLLGGGFLIKPKEAPAKPIIPVPTLEIEVPTLANR